MEKQDFTLEELFIQVQRMIQHYHMIQHGKTQSVFDVRQGQGRILTLLKKVNCITQKELVEILGIRQQSLGESLLKLEQGGYIVRKQSQEDKRVMVVEITEKGKALELERTNLNEIFDCLNEQEQQQFKQYLYRISERLENILQTEQQKPNHWNRRERRSPFLREEIFQEEDFREREFGREDIERERRRHRRRFFREDVKNFDRKDF